MLRQAIRPDYYTKHDSEPAYTTHIRKSVYHETDTGKLTFSLRSLYRSYPTSVDVPR